ncbi:glycerophosphodiester phosphodiesterase [Roseobacter sp. YSTF-M11]|uniref:Glycerophosphodiester phosphodiesterase n=1 Tax=Roseobacter insulae TaxID=2859783 RepID=A0A9X1K329_9RHOB|nr:glycerophosphodiester phosphodiesterase [Roseobacter insulae]MBW4708207.1 glycerophosphodiester phosphodiesterase [Roseobacter insulae]
MTVAQAYIDTWARRGVIVPIFLAVRLLSLAVILPVTSAVITLAISLSGQAALTDQDIARFFISPLGFPVFLGISAIILIASVLGLAAMTVALQNHSKSSLNALRLTLILLGQRFRAVAGYALRLVLRIVLITTPFTGVSLLIAQSYFGAYDINYYLTARPPEFLSGLALIAMVMGLMTVIVTMKLLHWSVSLHLVLFDEVPPRDCFRESARIMAHKRWRLLRGLLVWLAIRTALAFVLAVVFGWLIRHAADGFGTAFRGKLTLAMGYAALWWVCGMIISAVSLGALARLLYDLHEHECHPKPIVPQDTRSLFAPRQMVFAAALLALFGLLGGVLLINRVQSAPNIEIIAHRGAAGTRPENTLASVRKAVEDGADWVEIDVQETAEGDVVVMHDSDFMKLAGVDLKIWEATAEDLAGIDIGSWFDPLYAEERIPTLKQVLDVTRDRAKLLIELKYYGHDQDLEARTVSIVEAAGMAAQVATMSLKYPAVQKMNALRPGWPTGVLAATAVGNLAALDADFIAVSTSMAGPQLVQRARAQGKKLYVWTVNEPLTMSALMSLGVDGIITDEPALARQVMETRSDLTTAERLFILFADRAGLTFDENEYRNADP